MYNQLNEEFTLRKVEPFEMAFNLPFVIYKDNGDGTYQGHLDKDNMTISQKILSTYLQNLLTNWKLAVQYYTTLLSFFIYRT